MYVIIEHMKWLGEWVLAVHVLLSTGGEVGIGNTCASTNKKKKIIKKKKNKKKK